MEPVHWLYVIFLVPVGLGLGAFALMQIALILRNRRKRLLASVLAGDGRRYVLMADMHGMSVMAWHLYGLDDGAEPSEAMLTPGNAEGTLLSAYFQLAFMPEAGWSIEFVGEGYLIILMDGLYHSLFDITGGRALVHDTTSQASFSQWSVDSGAGGKYDRDAYAFWVEHNLHGPIEDALKKEGAL